MNTLLKSILENHGYVSETELPALAKEFPTLQLGIKFGCSRRIALPAREVANEIALRCKYDAMEYVREVFIPCEQYDFLCKAMGIKALDGVTANS